ncbi:MAG: hypothetical protein ABIS84_07155 [Arachnia sp.]
MQLIREFDALVHATGRLWIRFLPRVGTWLLLGWLAYTTCLVTSAAVGNRWGPAGAVIFVLGVTANVVGVIFAIHALKPGLGAGPRLVEARRQFPGASGIPDTVLAPERRVDVAVLAIGPVLGVYAVWAVIDGMIRDGILWNAITGDVYEAGDFSIGRSVADLPMYVGLGFAALVLRIGWGYLVRGRQSSWWRAPLVFLEGLWVFSTFFIVLLGVRRLHTWVARRAFWREGLHAWQQFLDSLPAIRLPFDVTLPQFLQRGSIWLTEMFLPGLWQGIALPLVWLAVTAMVFGWREFRARDLLTDSLRERADRLERTDASRTLSPVVGVLTEDLRYKWLPLLHTFRLVWRSGPWVLGAYLVLSALAEVGSWALKAILFRVFASGEQAQVLRSFTAIDAVQHLITTSVLVCLYAATFDRGLAGAAGLDDSTLRPSTLQAEPVTTQAVNVQ